MKKGNILLDSRELVVALAECIACLYFSWKTTVWTNEYSRLLLTLQAYVPTQLCILCLID